MARPRLNPDWLSTAERIRSELEAADFGNRGQIFRQHAESGVHSVASLRRDVTAAGFIASVGKIRPEFAANLRKLSSSSVTEVARLYRSAPERAVQQAEAAAKGLLTSAQMNAERSQRPIQAGRQVRQQQKTLFFNFIAAHEQRIDGYLGEGVYGLPDARLVLLDGTNSSGVVAFARVGEPDADVAQLLTYLGLLRYYEYVFLGISAGRLPARWAKYLQMTDPQFKRALDPEGLGISIYGPSARGFSNLIEEHPWPEYGRRKSPV
jgi:hypothetical protein